MIRLRFTGGAWVGMRGHLESDVLEILAGIAAASPYEVMLHDRAGGMAGTCNWSRNQIHVAVRGIVSLSLAHEVWHSVSRLIPAADYALVSSECANLFPEITPRMVSSGCRDQP